MDENDKVNLQEEVKSLFESILNACNEHSFPAIKAALLLARDHVIRKEAISENKPDGG